MALPRLKRLSVAAIITRFIAKLIRQWPWILLVVGVLSPISPHVRWKYYYKESHPNILFDCRYLGIRGFVGRTQNADCPFITLINTKN